MIVLITPKHSLTYDGAELKIFHANKGEGLPKHSHAYSHATICMSGSCFIRVEGKEILINKKTTPINLLSGAWHEIEAAEDETVFVNVFAQGKY